MLMSKSRLEKFLYALYSLDSSDLPAPLSRIEELYKCWVAGEEVPTFKPLSRVEKYLMAILGVYNVDELPNPLSRVEVLLYKLATGDDNLDDVKSFLSEHEELLAEIIRNGGVGGDIDIEYVLYTLSTKSNTLYNTAEKPVKSAILKGSTLVNLWDNIGQHSIAPNGFVRQVGDCFKKSTKYLLKYNVLQTNTNNSMIVQYYQNSTWVVNEPSYAKLNKDYYILTTPSADFNDIRIFYANSFGTETVILKDIMLIEYQDGMENLDIPYFEGMKSVQMPVLTTTGKNLLKDDSWESGTINANTGINETSVNHSRYNDFIPINTGDVFSLSSSTNVWRKYFLYDSNKNFLQTFPSVSTKNLTINIENTQAKYMRIWIQQDINTLDNDIQLERGAIRTSYEPYKSNILTVNEEVELRGIGEVQDELNLLTGELTERIGEITFDGSDDETWGRNGTLSNNYETSFFTLSVDNVKRGVGYITKICDKFPVLADYSHTKDIEGVTQITDNQMSIRVLKTSLSDDSVEGLKAYLQSNPITVQYQFITKSVKTVDLSTVNQDGNDTKLSTFNDITHVTLSSEGLIPEAELEVATKNEEVLNTMSLEMDDISKTQNGLQETLDTQSENIDSTMIATTEIYEGLL